MIATKGKFPVHYRIAKCVAKKRLDWVHVPAPTLKDARLMAADAVHDGSVPRAHVQRWNGLYWQTIETKRRREA